MLQQRRTLKLSVKTRCASLNSAARMRGKKAGASQGSYGAVRVQSGVKRHWLGRRYSQGAVSGGDGTWGAEAQAWVLCLGLILELCAQRNEVHGREGELA